MFEVGKKYGGTTDSSGNEYWQCIAVDGDKAWLRPFGKRGYLEGVFRFHEGWLELKPEPKRWSTWQNIFEFHTGGQWETRAKADFINKGSHSRLAILRRDFEQHEGEAAECVRVELERC